MAGQKPERAGKSGRPGGRRPPDRRRREDGGADGSVWLFGLHAVRDALLNPAREKRRLIVTRNAADRLGPEALGAGPEPEMSDPRRFAAPLDPQSVHQGAALEAAPLDWGDLARACAPRPNDPAPRVVVLDRVTDPHNVGAILRSAEVFGARAVIAPSRHSAPESGALAKTASGALERQPYLRVPNLVRAMGELRDLGYRLVGLDGTAARELDDEVGPGAPGADGPLALVLGAEGPGLRPSTVEACDVLARAPSAAEFASLNVSNAAAVALYAGRLRSGKHGL